MVNFGGKPKIITKTIECSPKVSDQDKYQISIDLSKIDCTDLNESKIIFSKKFIESSYNERNYYHNKRIILFKTEMCRSFNELGFCKYGDRCQFCHSRDELRDVKRHPKYKTEICKTFWNDGSCPYGSRCCFVHRENVLNYSGPKISDQSKNKNNKTPNSYYDCVKVFYDVSQIPDFDVITNPISQNNSLSLSLSDNCNDNGKKIIHDFTMNEEKEPIKNNIESKCNTIFNDLESELCDKNISLNSSTFETDTLDLQSCNFNEILNTKVYSSNIKPLIELNTNRIEEHSMFRELEINNYFLKMPLLDCEFTKRSLIKNYLKNKSKTEILDLEINKKNDKINSEFDFNNLIRFKQARAIEFDNTESTNIQRNFKFSIEAEYENTKEISATNIIEKWKKEPLFYIRYDQ